MPSPNRDRIDLTGRVAVVTGAGGALGSEYCRALAARGAAVVVNDLGGSATGEGSSTTYADKVVDEIRTAGGRAVANYETVATMKGGEAIIRAAVESFGRIDIVINNAGNQRNVKFGELTELDIDAVYAVHVKGTFFVTQPAYRLMAKQNYGRIVLVSSQSGMFGNPIRSNYGSAKTAMIGLMNVMAQELPVGIAVNCVFPNAVGGRLGGKPGDVRPDAAFLAEAGKRVPAYIDGMQPSFVAALVTYLCSEQCSTSQNMYSVLGGKYSRIFVGLTEGWYHPGKAAPEPEEILAHLPQIDDRTVYATPRSGLDEMDTVLALQTKLRAS
jgi:NAD(P)-dependent dehydrogenase (short-subunit alcohol dehydrogenase family)